MSSLRNILWTGLLLALTSFADWAPLDPPYENLVPPKNDLGAKSILLRWGDSVSAKDFESLIKFQTSVKNQNQRGLCSVFSAIGMLEYLLKKQSHQEYDLSENYLAYIVESKIKREAGKGIRAPENFEAIRYPGVIEEFLWPYEGEDWNSKNLNLISWIYAYFTCSFTGLRQEICLSSHRDPENDPFGLNAKDFAAQHLTSHFFTEEVDAVSEVQKDLLAQRPLLLEMDFFYGAWNHHRMKEYGLGKPDTEKWLKGEVGIPSAEDKEAFKKHPMGHSVLVVGFDTERQVYYFKNSWGKTGFGVRSDLLGPKTTPGYGTLPFEYAHHHGMFYRVH